MEILQGLAVRHNPLLRETVNCKELYEYFNFPHISVSKFDPASGDRALQSKISGSEGVSQSVLTARLIAKPPALL
jgi:hypothetical protein